MRALRLTACIFYHEKGSAVSSLVDSLAYDRNSTRIAQYRTATNSTKKIRVVDWTDLLMREERMHDGRGSTDY